MEALKEGEASLVVYLHPSKVKYASDALLSELSSLLYTYSEPFEGVVLAYDLNIVNKLAKVLPGIHPYVGVKLRAKLLLFNPKPGMFVEGVVVKITPHSVHAVVLGFSSACIAGEDIRDDFKHKVKHGKEVYVSRSNKKHKIKIGATLRFVVKNLGESLVVTEFRLRQDCGVLILISHYMKSGNKALKLFSFDEEILHISGSLVADHTGCAQWLDKNVDKWSQADSTQKRKIGKEEDEKPENERLMKEETSSLKNDEHVKKAKKRRKDHS
ncbi:hypothetical protein OROMI_030373 [Orobanche minor]